MTLEFKQLTMMDLRSSPGEIFDRVARDGESFVIERNGEQMACLVPVSVFLPDIKKSRLDNDLNKLQEQKLESAITILDTKEIKIKFLNALGSEMIRLSIVLPHGYPNVAPKIFADPLPEKTPHQWQDGSLCIFGAIASWNPGKDYLDRVYELGKKWVEHYYQWKSSDIWPSKREKTDDRK